MCSQTVTAKLSKSTHSDLFLCSDGSQTARCVHRLTQPNCPKVHIAICFCVQVGAKLQGVFTDCVTGLVCLIRRAALTYLRPCDQLERLYLCEQEWLTPKDLEDINFAVEGQGSATDGKVRGQQGSGISVGAECPGCVGSSGVITTCCYGSCMKSG